MITLKGIARLLLRKPSPAIYLGDNKALVKTFFGSKLYVDTRDLSLAPHLMMDGYWEPHVTRVMMQTLKQGMRVIEIGSNVGYYTTMIGRKIRINHQEDYHGRMICFEANPYLYQLLKDTIEINGLQDITNCHNAIVSNTTGVADFNILTKHHGSGSLLQFADNTLQIFNDKATKVQLPTVSLDSFLQAYHNKLQVDFMKIDAEGSEPLIFEGMKDLLQLNWTHIIIIAEFNPSMINGSGDNSKTKDFLEQITSYGLRLAYINKLGRIVPCSRDELLNLNMTCDMFLQAKDR